jgi:hypothetical protein
MEETFNTDEFNSLIGNNIFAEGWQYDNSGFVSGEITEIKPYKYGRDKVEVFVDTENKFSMKSFVFTHNQLKILLSCGELPTANKFLNTGTNAKIINI